MRKKRPIALLGQTHYGIYNVKTTKYGQPNSISKINYSQNTNKDPFSLLDMTKKTKRIYIFLGSIEKIRNMSEEEKKKQLNGCFM